MLARSVWHRVTWIATGVWIALLVASVAGQLILPNPRWYLIHVAGLGVAGTSILIWTWHFTDALTRSKQSQLHQFVRLLLHSVGTLVMAAALATSGMSGVVLGAIGSLLVSGAFMWHCWALRKAMGVSFVAPGAVTLRYHLAGGILFILGALAGLIMTIDVTNFELARSWWPSIYTRHDNMALVHVFLMVLGFIGMSVLGTIVTFGPTVARTRMDPRSLRWAVRTLPILVIAILTGVIAAYVDLPLIAGIAAAVWVIAGVVGVLLPVLRSWRGSMIGVGDGWTMGAALVWMESGCMVWAVQLATAPDAQEARSVAGGTYAIFLAAGALQLILGSLTYLLPMVAGGGPPRLRHTMETLERSAGARFFALNGALVLALLPVPTGVHYAAVAIAAATGLTGFVLLLAAVMAQQRRGPNVTVASRSATPQEKERAGARRGPRPMPDPRLKSGALIAACILAAGSVAGIGAQSPGTRIATTNQSASDDANAEVTEVDVRVNGMSFIPNTIEVPNGNRLIVNFSNTGDQRHDLVFENGAETGPVPTGEAATVDAGIIEESTQGWCSMVGHRQMGMTLDVVATGGSHGSHDAGTGSAGDGDTALGSSARGALPALPTMADLMAEPGETFEPWDAALDPASDSTTHNISLDVEEAEKEVAPGRTQKVWTFNGQTPGPVLRGKVGDRFVITLTNNGTMGHSIDFHAGDISPDDVMKTIEPGESLTYEFTANRSGIWLYHCSTSPMSVHIANGMYGAVIIDPPDLAPVDEEYVMIQGEQYWSDDLEEGTDASAVAYGIPSALTFNGYPFQYDHAPLTVQAGDRVRIWVLDAGPNLPLSFHVVGTQFDTVWSEGTYSLQAGQPAVGTGSDAGSQALGLLAAQGGFVEFSPREPGHYTMVNHAMSYAERGAHGTLVVK